MTERNYGLDLLRLVLMFMICMLHTLGQGGVLNACVFGTLSSKTFWLIETIAFCAVDGFAILSGYTSSDKPRKYGKIVEMWFQAFFYSFIITIVFLIIGMGDSLTPKQIIKSALPITFNSFWYFSAFFVLYLVIPILNKFIYSIDLKTSKIVLFSLVLLFSVISVFNDSFGLVAGYSAFWLIILYCIGATAKKIKLFETKKTITLILLFVACVAVTWSLNVFFNYRLLLKYISPTVLLCGIIIVVLFSRLRLNGKIISKVAPLAFGIYLFQINQIIWNTIIKDSFAFIVDKPIIIGVLYSFGFASAIFLCGLIVEFIRNKLAKALKIPVLSEKIVEWCKSLYLKIVEPLIDKA